MKLSEWLHILNKNELTNIARGSEISGYSKLKKDALIDLISSNMSNPETLEQLLTLLTPSAMEVLKILLQSRGQMEDIDLKKEMLKIRSKGTYYKAIREVQERSLVFEEWEEQEDEDRYYYTIPDDLVKPLAKLTETVVAIAKEEEEKEISEIKYFDDILDIFCTKKELKELAREAGLKVSGTKDELLNRVLYESVYDLDALLDTLFSKLLLRDICSFIEMPVSGTKLVLIERIIAKLPSRKERKLAPVTPTPEEKKRILAKPSVAIEEVPPKLTKKLWKEVYNLLDGMKIDRKAIKEEKDLEKHMLGFIRGYFQGKGVSIDVKAQSILAKETQLQRPDLVIGDREVAVELKYVKGQKDVDRACRQALSYVRLCDVVILYVFDPKEKFDKDFAFPRNVKLVHKS